MYKLKYIFSVIIALLFGINMMFYGGLLCYRSIMPHKTVFMYERLLGRDDLQLDYRPVPYDKISIHLKKAMIAAEDSQFSTHKGFDWQGIQLALQKNLKSGRIKAGGSTISQQTAKNLFLIPSRTFIRKGEEAWLTALMEATINKDRILSLYLNIIEWGDGIYGAEAAAQNYYKKNASSLNANESSFLASMATNPVYYQNHLNNRKLHNKSNIIKKRMKHSNLPTN